MDGAPAVDAAPAVVVAGRVRQAVAREELAPAVRVGRQRDRLPRPAARPTFASRERGASGVMNSLQGADVQPTANQIEARSPRRGRRLTASWRNGHTMKTIELPAVNVKLKAAGYGPLKIRVRTRTASR